MRNGTGRSKHFMAALWDSTVRFDTHLESGGDNLLLESKGTSYMLGAGSQ